MSEHIDELDNSDSEQDDITTSSSSMSAHRQLRHEMAADVEAFIAQGGEIEVVEPNVMADPPRKPQSNYGSRPI